jgi:hypothetical protein
MNREVIMLIPIYFSLIFVIAVLMFARRMRALKNRLVGIGHFKAYQGESPEDLRVIQNHFSNQFQVPVLFFVTCLSAVQLNSTSQMTVTLGYTFIASRIFHSYIHLGKNNLRYRAAAYGAGLMIIIAMWCQILLN